jgi:hypothetical protein
LDSKPQVKTDMVGDPTFSFDLTKPRGTTNYHPNILYTATIEHHRFELSPKSLLTSLLKS